MPRHTHLLRRGSQYYVNVRVPKDLRGILNKEIIRRSLQTSDLGEAVRRVRLESVRIHDEFETLRSAASRLLEAGFTAASHLMRVYVLIGYPKDTFAAAEQRLQQMLQIGFTPYAMLWRPETPSQMKWAPEESWRTFQRRWARPAIIHARETRAYSHSAIDRARVQAARAAQRDDARDRANVRPAGRPAKSGTVYNNESNNQSDVHGSERPAGNSRAAFLRRLRKHRPDIHARVLAGELSPHAGMIEAGFRKQPNRKHGGAR